MSSDIAQIPLFPLKYTPLSLPLLRHCCLSVGGSHRLPLWSGYQPTFSRTPKQLCQVISLSNFEQALKEITPSSSESLGTLSELRKWNDEFGEGKMDKGRSMWGRSFGIVEKGEVLGET